MGTTQTQEVRNVLQNGVFNTCHFLWGWCQTKPSLLNPSDASLKVGTMRISTYRPCFLFVVLRSISVPGITSLSHQSMSFLFLQPYSNSKSQNVIIFSLNLYSFYILLSISISTDTQIRNPGVIPSFSFFSCPTDHTLQLTLALKNPSNLSISLHCRCSSSCFLLRVF